MNMSTVASSQGPSTADVSIPTQLDHQPEEVPVKKRGRPKKSPTESQVQPKVAENATPGKKRGRPRLHPVVIDLEQSTPSKKRGRPSKKQETGTTSAPSPNNMVEQPSKGSVLTDKAGQLKNEQPAKRLTPIEIAIKIETVDDEESEEEDERVLKKRGRPRKNASSGSDTRMEDENRAGGSKSSVKPNTDNQENEDSQEEDEPPIKRRGRGRPRKIVSSGSESEKPQKVSTKSKEAGIPFKKRGVPPLKDPRVRVYTCPEPECRFWAKSVNHFHDHVVEAHGTEEPAFKCSVCTFRAQQWALVHQHLKEFREACDGAHSNAHLVCVQPVPDHRYAGTVRLLEVPENMAQGLLSLDALRPDSLEIHARQQRFEATSIQPSFALPPRAVGVQTDEVKTVEEIVQINPEEESRYRTELSQLEEDIQNGFRLIEAARQERDTGPAQLEQLNTDQQATESKIEELQFRKKELASRLASLNNQTDKVDHVMIDKLYEEDRALEQQLNAETVKLVPLAQKREKLKVALDSLPDKIPDLIAAQKILIQKRHTAKKPIVALELEKETKGFMDQLIY